jgi:molybdate transport system substrate-binding protein
MGLKNMGLVAGLMLMAWPAGVVQAASVNVAVAANFTAVAEALSADFKARIGHELILSFGASGALYTQITQGAPFEVFLSADTSRPAQAIADGLAVEGTAFTYAVGKLVLYSASMPVDEAVLRAGGFAHVAIADPETAPYGSAAIETLKALGLHDDLAPKLVTGTSIAQVLQFVETGNAELGFVAASQVTGKPNVWSVPADLHTPIAQGAVLLKAGEGNPSAANFLTYLRSAEAAAIIGAAGYGVVQ